MINTQRYSSKLILAVGVLLAVAAVFFFFRGKTNLPPNIMAVQDKLPATIDYNIHVKPILSDKCFVCHGPDKGSQKANLNLANPKDAFRVIKNTRNRYAIVPGNPSGSELFHRITASDQDKLMPPPASNLSLTDLEKAILIQWIEEGAKYKTHWALIKPEKRELPKVKNTSWPRNPIDLFTLSKMEEHNLSPSKEADREILIRRVTLDLTGLPPTVEEIDTYLADQSPEAFEKVVDRLLASKHYGEKLGVDWLDLARFADTHGYTVDRYRPMWPYRDWVIKAFNENLPYDQFITWQLAGDLLPNATREQKLATAFNRNHSQNMEGGIVNEEFRVEYVADRTNTLGTAFLGMTVECARCHDHKYDPISQKDYYSLFAFFNNIDEAGQISWDDALPVPTMMLTSAKVDSIISFLAKQEENLIEDLSKIQKTEQPEFQQWKSKGMTPINPDKDMIAHFSFDELIDGKFKSTNSRDVGTVLDPVLKNGISGKAFQSNGDDVLSLGKLGTFNRSAPFSISIWINIPANLHHGVVFHDGNGDILYNFRGYFFTIRDDKAELLMAHTWPYNSIVKISKQPLPKEKWIHIAMTYDGSGKAAGLKFFLNGAEAEMDVEHDNLYKDIVLKNGESGLKIAADMRGVGFKQGLVDEFKVYDRELTPTEIGLTAGIYSPASLPNDDKLMEVYYLNNVSLAYRQSLVALQKIRNDRVLAEDTVKEVMVMAEMKTPRPSFILKRGAYDAHGESVTPGIPASILPFSDDLPKNRLGLAQWLLDPNHPLTARVAVNRYWQTYFGKGLNKSTNNFGNQGGTPTHPELLDWLAVQFRESGWNIKALQRMIVLSATYRQASTSTQEKQMKDPENVYLSIGPSFRMSAEMIRDHALASAGLLSPKTGGPSVKPYQPEGLWSLGGGAYEQEHGENLYRRSLYTFWKRTNPPPSMNTFDAPSRSYCVVQRQKTSTPLQALVMMNDPQFIEAARLAAFYSLNKSDDNQERIKLLFRQFTSRLPLQKEAEVLSQLFQTQVEKFNTNPSKMKGWLTAGEFKTKEIKDKTTWAALTVVASTIMNSDAFLTRR